MMKHISKLAAIPFILLTVGCDSNMTPFSPVQEGEGDIEVCYRVDGQLPETRGISAELHETVLNKTHLLFFNPMSYSDPEKAGVLVAYKEISVGSGSSKFSFTAPENIETDVPYQILALGNANEFTAPGVNSINTVLDEHISNQTTFENVFNSLMANHNGPFTSANISNLPLFGRWLDDEGNEQALTFQQDGDKMNVLETGYFFYSRAVCRLDIHNLVGNVLHITHAKVVNYRDRGFYYRDFSGKDSGIGDLIAYTPGNGAPAVGESGNGYMPVTSGTSRDDMTQELKASLYTFPNIVNYSAPGDQETTALIIAGYYHDETELTYYRFNFATPGASQVLQRNYCYTAVIKGVKARGADTENEAYNSKSSIFISDIEDEWDTQGDNVTSDEYGNFLIVNRTHITFSGDAQDADFVELRVSTANDMDWKIEAIDNAQGNNNDCFSVTRINQDNVIRCGPTSQNTTENIRMGYFKIVATPQNTDNNSTPAKPLEVKLYLIQMSTNNDIDMLTVDGKAGVINMELGKYGETLMLEVVTGRKGNEWSAQSNDDEWDGIVDEINEKYGTFNKLTDWDTQGVSLTTSGDNKGLLIIKVPANISAPRRTSVHVKLKTPKEGVQDVVLNLWQKKADILMDIVGKPTRLEIDCLDYTDFGNPNGVVNSKGFMVRLTDDRYRWRVWSDFDMDRDMALSLGSSLSSTGANATKAKHYPENADSEYQIRNQKENTIKEDATKCVNGAMFYINPFRMGPEDPDIHGKVYVEAYIPDDPEAPTVTESFDVTLFANKNVKIDDVVLQDTPTSAFYLFPDRNIGTPGHLDALCNKVTAHYYDDRKNTYIYGPEARQPSKSPFRGSDDYFTQHSISKNGNGYHYNGCSPTLDVLKFEWIQKNKDYNFLYASSDSWALTYAYNNSNFFKGLTDRAIFSKGRCFIVTHPDFYTGDGYPVCCWLHHISLKNIKFSDTDIANSNTYPNGSFYCIYRVITTGGTDYHYFIHDNGINLNFYLAANPYGAYSYKLRKTATRLYRPLTDDEANRYKTEVLHQ